MDLEYRPVSGAALALMREGHNHPDMVATLAEIVSDFGAGGVPPAPENTDGETEDIGGLEVTHRFVEAPGESESIRWHFVEAGEGPVLLLMHGIPQSWYMWQPILAELAKHFRCIAIDLKGYGQSDQGRGDYRHEGVAEQVVALLDVLDIDRFNLFSHDRGTVQADFVAAKHSDRVIRWVRGSQHLIHFHPDLAPQELLFSDLETRGILQDPVKMFQWGYGRLCKHPIAKPGVVRAIQEFSRPGTGLAVERYFQSSTFRKDWIDRRWMKKYQELPEMDGGHGARAFYRTFFGSGSFLWKGVGRRHQGHGIRLSRRHRSHPGSGENIRLQWRENSSV